MRERLDEPATVAALVVLLLVLWLGFFVHRSPQFAGSAWGVALAVAAALALIGAGAYGLLKGASGTGGRLRWHVHLGVVAALLALLHTGHKFQSTLGMVLTAAMLAVVLGGFAGRYVLALVGEDERDLRNRLESLRLEYRRLAADAAGGAVLSPAAGGLALALAEAMADLEYGLAARERLRRVLARWRWLHRAASLTLFALLALHIWAALEFGLRWLR